MAGTIDTSLLEALRKGYRECRAYSLFEMAEPEIAKTPAEYGKDYLDRKYTEFRSRFFGGDQGYLPRTMPIGFCNSTKKLGYCATTWRRGPFNQSSLVDCGIKLSNAFDYTPKTLDEVLIHEMIHAYLAYSPDREDNNESHGPRFTRWCDRINSSSNYKITVVNDTPLTLNNGMKNRIDNDGSVLLLAPNAKPGVTAVTRVHRDNLQWALSGFSRWFGMEPKCYKCNDANFKRRLTLNRSRLSAQLFPNSMIEDMLEGGILVEDDGLVEQARTPQAGKLLAWHLPGNKIGYCLVSDNVIPDATEVISWKLESMSLDSDIAVYNIVKYFPDWGKPVVNSVSGSLPYNVIDANYLNDWVQDGIFTPMKSL